MANNTINFIQNLFANLSPEDLNNHDNIAKRNENVI